MIILLWSVWPSGRITDSEKILKQKFWTKTGKSARKRPIELVPADPCLYDTREQETASWGDALNWQQHDMLKASSLYVIRALKRSMNNRIFSLHMLQFCKHLEVKKPLDSPGSNE